MCSWLLECLCQPFSGEWSEVARAPCVNTGRLTSASTWLAVLKALTLSQHCSVLYSFSSLPIVLLLSSESHSSLHPPPTGEPGIQPPMYICDSFGIVRVDACEKSRPGRTKWVAFPSSLASSQNTGFFSYLGQLFPPPPKLFKCHATHLQYS